MVEDQVISQGAPVRAKKIALGVMALVVVAVISIAGSYLVSFHEGMVVARNAIHAQQVSDHVKQVAEEGRSRALCNALLELAVTPQAHKLHPIFVQVYNHTGCDVVLRKHP